MRRRLVPVFILVVLASLFFVPVAQAQAPSVELKFGFVVGGKTYAAGTYAVDIAANGNVVLTPAGGAAIEIPQQKVVSKRNVDRPELVFDMVGNLRFLSEVWVPGKGGVQVAKEAGAEEQVRIKGSKAAK